MSQEPETVEMILPPVVGGHAISRGVNVSYQNLPIDVEFSEEHFERGADLHDVSAYYTENIARDSFFNFIVPQNDVVRSIALQADAQFRNRGFPKKVAVVGFAESKKDAPYGDPSWEIWGLNDLHGIIPRETRHFDIHTPEVIDIDVTAGRAPKDKCGMGGLSHLSVPVYMQKREPSVPNSVQMPLTEILETFSKLSGARYFTNSISYMIAFALYEGIITGHQWEQIGVYGVDMAVGTEYEVQRASCEYWIGIAEGMGVKVHIPDTSDLNKTAFLYAYETKKQMKFEQKMRDNISAMEARLKNIDSAIEQNLAAKYQHLGAIGYGKEALKIWSNLDTKLF